MTMAVSDLIRKGTVVLYDDAQWSVMDWSWNQHGGEGRDDRVYTLMREDGFTLAVAGSKVSATLIPNRFGHYFDPGAKAYVVHKFGVWEAKVGGLHTTGRFVLEGDSQQYATGFNKYGPGSVDEATETGEKWFARRVLADTPANRHKVAEMTASNEQWERFTDLRDKVNTLTVKAGRRVSRHGSAEALRERNDLLEHVVAALEKVAALDA